MALWFLRGVRTGIVTTAYPRRPDPSAALLPTPPTFSPTRLDVEVAQRLIAVCPSRALNLESGALVLDVGRCTACGRCLRVAEGVGSPSGEFEWATRRPETLRVRFPLEAER